MLLIVWLGTGNISVPGSGRPLVLRSAAPKLFWTVWGLSAAVGFIFASLIFAIQSTKEK